MKKFKKGKLLAAAIALLSFSAAASVTGTVAWFTASNIVNVSSMSIQAQTEEGIVISNEDKTAWGTSAVAKWSTSASVLPTSTADATTWYRNNSDDDHTATGSDHVGTYLSYTEKGEGEWDHTTFYVENGLGKIDVDKQTATVDDTKNIFLLNKFYIKSTTNSALTSQKLYINSVTIGETASVELHKAARVLVKSGSAIKIYGITGCTATYGVNGAASGVEVITEGDILNNELLSSTTIPANNTESPLEIEVYAYFEGEDGACTTANANQTNALASLAVSLQFGTKLKA